MLFWKKMELRFKITSNIKIKNEIPRIYIFELNFSFSDFNICRTLILPSFLKLIWCLGGWGRVLAIHSPAHVYDCYVKEGDLDTRGHVAKVIQVLRKMINWLSDYVFTSFLGQILIWFGTTASSNVLLINNLVFSWVYFYHGFTMRRRILPLLVLFLPPKNIQFIVCI